MGRASSCDFYNEETQVAITVHGDEFFASGLEAGLQALEATLRAKYHIKTEMLGAGPGQKQEIGILNRVLRLTAEGIVYEPEACRGCRPRTMLGRCGGCEYSMDRGGEETDLRDVTGASHDTSESV